MKIAIVGGGVSGLVAAYKLRRAHELTIFEADDRIGGHTHTVDVDDPAGRVAVDTGFIVFNEFTYPNFCQLLHELGVATQTSDMSFSVQCGRSGLEYCGNGLNGLFAQRRNALRPSFHRMIQDIMRFNRSARDDVARAAAKPAQQSPTLAAYLEQGRYSREFVDHYITPMGAAVWSADPASFAEIPLDFFVRFLDNHRMLEGFNRPLWRVIRGGSHRYVEKLIAALAGRIRLSTPIDAIRRDGEGGSPAARRAAERFDRVVLAVHSDQALAMLTDNSAAECEILSAIRYQTNETVLHTDEAALPRRKRAWASWNYYIPPSPVAAPTVSYHMNRLQRLRTARQYIVTLNRPDAVNPQAVVRRIIYQHPVYTRAAVAAQQRVSEISGVNRTHYCGAYWGDGFHEAGVNSGLRVAAELGELNV